MVPVRRKKCLNVTAHAVWSTKKIYKAFLLFSGLQCLHAALTNVCLLVCISSPWAYLQIVNNIKAIWLCESVRMYNNTYYRRHVIHVDVVFLIVLRTYMENDYYKQFQRQ